MNLRELEAQAEFLAPVIASAGSKAVGPPRERLAAIDEQIAALIKSPDEMPDVSHPGNIGRASGRERVEHSVGAVSSKKKA